MQNTGKNEFGIRPIARIKNDFPEKFGIPRQSGLIPEAQSLIIFEHEFRNEEALRGIEEYSHLWLIWQFSENLREGWSPTVRPPRLGGNKRVGVFATRSPFRPNFLGLSSVKLEGIEHTAEYGTVLKISGADLMDGTPIFDIKPYVLYTDSHPDSVCGFADRFSGYSLEVDCGDELLSLIPEEKRPALLKALANDPRPSYQHDENRIYCMSFSGFTVSFTVSGGLLTVCGIEKLKGEPANG